MGEVTVYFVGICTHMQWPEDEVFGKVEAFRHRVSPQEFADYVKQR